MGAPYLSQAAASELPWLTWLPCTSCFEMPPSMKRKMEQRASSSSGKASTRSLVARAFGLGKPKKLKVDLPPNIYRRASFFLNLKDVFVPPSHAHMRRLELGVRDKKRQ